MMVVLLHFEIRVTSGRYSWLRTKYFRGFGKIHCAAPTCQSQVWLLADWRDAILLKADSVSLGRTPIFPWSPEERVQAARSHREKGRHMPHVEVFFGHCRTSVATSVFRILQRCRRYYGEGGPRMSGTLYAAGINNFSNHGSERLHRPTAASQLETGSRRRIQFQGDSRVITIDDMDFDTLTVTWMSD